MTRSNDNYAIYLITLTLRWLYVRVYGLTHQVFSLNNAYTVGLFLHDRYHGRTKNAHFNLSLVWFAGTSGLPFL